MIFWICQASIFALAPPRFFQAPLARLWGRSPLTTEFWTIFGDIALYFLPFGLFLTIGWLAMEELLGIYPAAEASLADSQPEAAAKLGARGKELKKAADLGITLGGLVLGLVVVLANVPQA
jgi:hypothetical protein